MMLLLGLALGAAFGAVLQLAGASSHTKIANALRLKDLTIIKLILAAGALGLVGVHVLDFFGWANMKVKDLYLPGVAVAGLIFGVGFAVSGYCPGTALAAAAEGKPDAWATVAGASSAASSLPFSILISKPRCCLSADSDRSRSIKRSGFLVLRLLCR